MTNMHVIDRGEGNPLVWIHGFPLSSLIFEPQLGIANVRHIVPDLPGFGDSPSSAIGSIDDYASKVAALLRERGISRAVFAGVSMGGYITFSIARNHPGLVAGLILIDTREVPDTPEAKQNRRNAIGRVESEGTGFLVDEMLPKMLTATTLATADRRTEIVQSSMQSASSAGVKAALEAMASRRDSTEVLRSFEGPVLVVVGEDDEITPPADAERMSSIARDATLVRIDDAAHLSNVERPDKVNAAVRRFLDAIS